MSVVPVGTTSAAAVFAVKAVEAMPVASPVATGKAIEGSAETSAAAGIESGAVVWISCPETVWRSGRVVEKKHAGQQFVVEFDDREPGSVGDGEGGGEQTTIALVESKGGPPLRRVLRRNAMLIGDGALRFNDLTDVPELHEAALLHALEVRFMHGVIYTLTGPVLLAVNPFRVLPGLYGQDQLRSFIGTDRPKPHVFGVAGLAFHNICERGVSQTVLVSGESGSGKTETTKFVIQFLALAGAESAASGRGPLPAGGRGTADGDSSNAAGGGGPEGGDKMSKIERQVLGSNPLLEAFGNAKTLRNDNSSRFGKYIELQFGTHAAGSLITPRFSGARIRTYLLEKVRVIRQQEGERSFHVFYQAVAAAQAQASLSLDADSRELSACGAGTDSGVDLSGFGGRPASSFAYLGGGGRSSAREAAASETLVDEFDETLTSMRSVGFGRGEVSDVFRSLAAVLLLGELAFVEQVSEQADIVDDEAPSSDGGDTSSPVRAVCGLLGVTAADLKSALCSRTMQAPGEARVIRMPNTASKAGDTRDALARHLYNGIFCHVVEKANASIGFQEEATFCGVLDIFGFEFFEINSFEQLCINYTNELLQQYFNSFIFETEAALYAAEGIAWDPLSFPHNEDIVALLHEKHKGIFPMLEEECFSVGGSSEAWCNKIVREHDNHPNFRIVKHKVGFFTVQHFAGPVEYTAHGFLEKNRDQLSADLLQCLQKSDRSFIRTTFQAHGRVFGTGGGGGTTPRATGESLVASRRMSAGSVERVTRAQRYSVSSEFRQQLQDLLSQIRATAPHFVRCIKPNPKNQAFVPVTRAGRGRQEQKPWLERPAVAEQLRYQGVLEAIRVARAGYPVRFPHAEFVRDFRSLASADLRGRLLEDARRAAAAADAATGLVDGAPQSVRELLASPELQKLLSPVLEKHGHCWAVGRTRIFLKQEPFGVLRNALSQQRFQAATRLQAAQRGHAARRACKRCLRALLRLQARWRGGAVRSEIRQRRSDQAAARLGASLRTLLARAMLRRARGATISIQRMARGRSARKTLLSALMGAMRLQRWWRSLVKRRRWRTLQTRVLNVQRLWRGALGRRKAIERRVQLCRLRRVLRKLVWLRRRNDTHRAFRKEMMGWYKGKGQVTAAPERADLVHEILALHEIYNSHDEQVQNLRSEVACLGDRIEELWSSACLKLRGIFVSPAGFPRPT